MNKYEAIEILEEVKILDDSMYQYNQCYCDALDMAIESLKTEAIPVEWVKKWIFEHPYFCVTGSTLLGDWQKEQRKD